MSIATGQLADAVRSSTTWAQVMRELGLKPTGGRRRALQRAAADHGIDVGHFVQRSPWRKYSDAALAEAVASSTSLREVARRLGARPATGTLSHLRRRIAAAGLDVAHFRGLGRERCELEFTVAELTSAAQAARSLRSLARRLGLDGEDSRSRGALRRMLAVHAIDTSHFSHARLVVPEEPLREAVARCASYADVMRELGLAVHDANHRRVRRRISELDLDTSHFKRRSRRGEPAPPARGRLAAEALCVLPPGSPRPRRDRLRRALDALGVPYACAGCGNRGWWRERAMTLHVDHVNGDWLDNRRDNLRYLCPNCHAVTSTWGRGGQRSGARSPLSAPGGDPLA